MTETKSDLVKTLESQKEKIHKYETKIKDLVAAYKSQIKENETLQATVKSLRAAAARRNQQPQNSLSLEEDGGAEISNEEVSQQEEIDRLSKSMTDLLEEKKKIQSAAIAERKALKQDYEEKLLSVEENLETVMEENSKNLSLSSELKKKLRSEQMEREREQADHAAMLRELNKNINDRMSEKEDLVHQVEDLKKELQITRQQPTHTENYEVMIADLTSQLQEMKLKVRDYENRANQQLMISQVQQEITDIKKQHAASMVKEQERADEAENRLQEIAKKSELRISELESKISQLSDMVGNYEKLKYTDQISIQKLKERVTQLDQENTALAKVANPSLDDTNLGIEELVDKLKHLKTSLQQACEAQHSHFEYNIVVGEIFMDETRLHKKCDEEYSQLKEEFERYKLRAQSVLKNKSSKDQNNSKEVEDLRNTIIELKERLRCSFEKHQSDDHLSQQTIAELRQSITNLHSIHKQELSANQAECHQKISDAEQRLRQHRDRTITLLAEKDKEIEMMREKLHPGRSSQTIQTYSEQQGEVESPVEELFHTDTSSSNQLIHFHQELSRSNLEITSLRKQKRDLEVELHDLRSNMSLKEDQHLEQLSVLKEEIRRLDRTQSREGINLEYLKNIVYRYMIATDPVGKQAIFNAIATILHFSPQERKQASSKPS
ncbi:GCC1 [Bugula neritina]|uniref:GCC1 n=1 Tax=Bugula neritina TaxID=10212 RepID=A0A7J7JF32_BUGNE|nr:GCC1 [Bugula neritina]